MKTIKLTIAVLLAASFGVLAFIEPAEAQRRRRVGNDYSETGEDQQNVEARFTLVDTTRDGNPIAEDETTQGDDDIGLFVGAIENYALAQGEICVSSSLPECAVGSNSSPFNNSSRYFYNSSGFPIFLTDKPLETIADPFDGNLLAQLFEPGEDPLFPTSSTTAIVYSILNPEENEPVSSYRLSNLVGINITQAVNSLTYILENNLLGAAQPVTLKPTDEFGNPIYELTIGNILVQNQFEQDISNTTVPEPGTTVGSLLALAALSAGALRKCKVKQS